MKSEILFEIKTPLNVTVRTTTKYWDYLINIKHQVMENREKTVTKKFISKTTLLSFPGLTGESRTAMDARLRTSGMTYREDICALTNDRISKAVLSEPDMIRKSKIDDNVFLYYKQQDKLYCVVVRHEGQEGFLITAYPTDKVKEGEILWIK